MPKVPLVLEILPIVLTLSDPADPEAGPSQYFLNIFEIVPTVLTLSNPINPESKGFRQFIDKQCKRLSLLFGTKLTIRIEQEM